MIGSHINSSKLLDLKCNVTAEERQLIFLSLLTSKVQPKKYVSHKSYSFTSCIYRDEFCLFNCLKLQVRLSLAFPGGFNDLT